jgi:urease accessory protein
MTQNLAPALKRQWLAHLGLTLSFSAHGTQLVRTQRSGPLTVQKAFYPEGRDCAHVYILHPPAGIVSGDELKVDIELTEDAHALVTTPGANRFYRARDDHNIGAPEQRQTTQLQVANGAKCEHFPLETIVYEGAAAINRVDVHLHTDSVYLGWDISCLGLPSAQQPFEQGRFSQLTQIYCDGKIIYHDKVTINPNNQLQQHCAGLANNSVFATFVAYAPAHILSEPQRQQLIDTLRQSMQEHNAEHLISVTHIKQLLIMRYLGQHAEQCKQLFIILWQQLRPLYIQKDGIQPRIWHT